MTACKAPYAGSPIVTAVSICGSYSATAKSDASYAIPRIAGTLVQTYGVLPCGICAANSHVVLYTAVGLLAHAIRITYSSGLAARTMSRGRIITAETCIRVVQSREDVAFCWSVGRVRERR